jgi:hypothetical protein
MQGIAASKSLAVAAGLLSILAGCGSSPNAPGELHASDTAGALFSDDFESGTLAAWEDGVDRARHQITTDPSARSGKRFLAVTYPPVETAGG